MVDGANQWQALRTVVLPLAIPGLVVAAILCFVFSWNEFLFRPSADAGGSEDGPSRGGQFHDRVRGPLGRDDGHRHADRAAGRRLRYLSPALVRGLTMGAVK